MPRTPVPGMDDDEVPTCPVLRMATEHGAATTPFAKQIGKLEPGPAADWCCCAGGHRISLSRP